MKTLKLFSLLACMILCVITASAQETKDIMKERQEIKKMTQKELNAKVDKSVKKEAKRLAKEGWQISPGSLPLEKQLQRSYEMQLELDDQLFPKYIMASAQSIGQNHDAAKTAATSLAITNLAGQIQTEVCALTSNSVGNNQLSAEEAASITESVMAGKTMIAQSIGRTIVVTELYRVLPNKNREVLVRIAYSGEMAKQSAQQAIREDLSKKASGLAEQLDKLLGL